MYSEDLLKDLKRMSISEVSVKYDLTLKELFEITRKYGNTNNVKVNDNTYISKTSGGKWSIRKSIKGKMCYYGTYGLKKDAILIVKELIKVDWDIEELPNILERNNIQSKSERIVK